MSTHSYGHRIERLKLKGYQQCRHCEARAIAKTVLLFRAADGVEGRHCEEVCDVHALEFARTHNLSYRPESGVNHTSDNYIDASSPYGPKTRMTQ
jgi:hypothetical protein